MNYQELSRQEMQGIYAGEDTPSFSFSALLGKAFACVANVAESISSAMAAVSANEFTHQAIRGI